MSEETNKSEVELLAPILDGLPEGPERSAFLEELRGEGAEAELELQASIDAELAGLFPIARPPDGLPGQLASATGATSPRAKVSRRVRGGLLAAAAAAGLLAVAASAVLNQRSQVTPFFEQRPLVAIYQDAVASGFEPYYECEDDDRFAAVFARRQGRPLALMPMPAGRRMLGLSYPGGLSRDTTAMLCDVNGQPVIVFVDRRSADDESDPSIVSPTEKIRVFRSELRDLVLYEVTPLNGEHAAPYLVGRDAASSAP